MPKTNYEMENKELRKQLDDANARIAELEGKHPPKHHEDPLIKKLKDEQKKTLDTKGHHA